MDLDLIVYDLSSIAALNVLIWNQSRKYLNSVFCWYNRSTDKPLSEVNKLTYTSSLLEILEIFVLDGYQEIVLNCWGRSRVLFNGYGLSYDYKSYMNVHTKIV